MTNKDIEKLKYFTVCFLVSHPAAVLHKDVFC